jgi:hypothetical protein
MSSDDTSLPKTEARRGLFRRIYDFFDSKIGLAILTFLLTGGLGTLATWVVTDIQHFQAAQSAALQARSAELGSLHSGVEAAILEREIATDSYIKAVEIGAGDAEIEQLWQKYEDTVHEETLSALQSHLVITGHTQDGPDPGQLEGKSWVFWTYLSNVIQPRFSSMHECLLGVHNAYVNAELPLVNRLSKARAELAGCQTDKDWDKYSYTYTRKEASPDKKGTPAAKATTSIAEWDDFKACLEDYTYLLDMSARLEARVGQSALYASDSGSWGGCAADDDACRQKKFLDTVPVVLPQSCGGIDNDFQ